MLRKIKIFVSVFAFLLLFSGVYYIVDKTLQFKYEDGILPMEDLYAYPDNSVDVLFLGSSHVGANVDTVRLCNDYGIAAYNLWGSVQPTWNSYYNLVEALKTQKPRVVVLETFLVSQDYEYMDYSRIIKNTMGMKMSKNKVDAVFASATPDVLSDVLLGFSTYHTRYNELSETDFERYSWNMEISDKNIDNGDYVTPCTLPVKAGEETEELAEKMETYFLKIIELCEEQDIPLLLYTSPYSASAKEMRRYNKVAQIAEEYRIPYLNYNLNYQEIGIDFASDYCDSAGHFNNSGVKKMTEALGSYLKANYDLPERYGDRWFNMWPDTEAVYMLHEPFEGDGEKAFLDTGTRLYYDEKMSYTILMQFDPAVKGDNQVFLSCFSEEAPYRGLLVRGEGNLLQIIVGDNYYIEVPRPKGTTATLAVTKKTNSYNVYLNGEIVAENIISSCEEYEGNLLIGCQETPEGKKQRFSKISVSQMEVYDKVLAESAIYDWMSEHASKLTKEQVMEMLTQKYTGDISYKLEEPFTGDGESTYLDTGAQLFFEEGKDFTLLLDYNTKIDSADGVIAGCFAEEQGAYRGLLIRRDADVVHVIIGENYYVEIRPDEDTSAKIAVTKENDTYSVYVNGLPVAQEIKSPCKPYIGTLLIGAQETEDFEKFRYSAVTVNRLEVREEIMSLEEIQRW